jgi:nitroimidazol reductase NimA-like FMN-containing flavoprotein (pyridoxamine 5'-phosphate oxidase superfamily)
MTAATTAGETTPPRRSGRELAASRCRDLLSSHDVGRIAWTAAHGPELFPVSYVYHDGMIIFRTSPYGVLSELIRPTDVVFEVDELDRTRRTGWSVIARGRAAAIPDPAGQNELWASYHALPWADGSRLLVIGIAVRQVTGRTFGRDPDED